MADTPGWVSNADLAARLSALVDRWNQRENEMIDFISFDGEGDITVHTGDGVTHSLKSFPQLEAEVTAWLDSLAGAVAQAQDINSQTIVNANAAEASAQDAANSAASIVGDADAAAASASAAATSASAASTSASQASTSASDAAASKIDAAASATAAASSADDADTDAIAAAQSAQAAADYAAQAGQAAAGKLAWFGVWNITGGTLPPDAAVPGFYLVSGTATIGSEKYADGDMLVWGEESVWHRIDNQQTVASVAGLVGTISVGQLQSALMLGTAAYKNIADFASPAHGAKADSAVQPNTAPGLSGVRVGVPTDFWSPSTTLFTGSGYIGSNGSFALSLRSNGYRNTNTAWTSMGVDGNTKGSGIDLLPNGQINFLAGPPGAYDLPRVGGFDTNGDFFANAATFSGFVTAPGLYTATFVTATSSTLCLRPTGNGTVILRPLQNDSSADASVDSTGAMNVKGSITIGGGKKLSKITVSSAAPGTLADGELYLQY